MIFSHSSKVFVNGFWTENHELKKPVRKVRNSAGSELKESFLSNAHTASSFTSNALGLIIFEFPKLSARVWKAGRLAGNLDYVTNSLARQVNHSFSSSAAKPSSLLEEKLLLPSKNREQIGAISGISKARVARVARRSLGSYDTTNK